MWDCFGPKNEDDDSDACILTSEQIFGRSYLEGLVFEMFALSAIHSSEEIFFDYGTTWSQAWNVNVQRWKDFNPCRGRVSDI